MTSFHKLLMKLAGSRLGRKKIAMSQSPESRVWDLSGLEVTFLHFDNRFTVDAWSAKRSLSIIFESPFVLREASGETRLFDPVKNETLGRLLSLLHRPVICFEAWSDGRCVLRFVDGTEIRGEPDPQFEAWEAHGTGGLSTIAMLCGPGGRLPWGCEGNNAG